MLHASRALVAVAARSLGAVSEDVTLPQYRALVVLAAQGPMGVGPLAGHLGVSPSTATRMSDRLVRKRLVRRRIPSEDRRQVRLALTEAGQELVAEVTRRRRADIARVLRSVPPRQRQQMVESLQAFADAAGEKADRDWSAGWDL